MIRFYRLLLLAGLAASKAMDESSNIRTEANRMKNPKFISITHNFPETHKSTCMVASRRMIQLYWGSCSSESARLQAPIDPLRPSLLKTADGKLCMSIDPDSPRSAVILRPCQNGTVVWIEVGSVDKILFESYYNQSYLRTFCAWKSFVAHKF
jgi:hypothetical protein